jgi:hypothetical protein
MLFLEVQIQRHPLLYAPAGEAVEVVINQVCGRMQAHLLQECCASSCFYVA